MSTIKVDTIATRTGSGNITLSNSLANATIVGDLTVDTSTLKVDATNNRVGIGTTSPSSIFHTEENTTSASIVRHKNTSNTSSAHSRLIIQNGGTSGGDALINLDTQASGSRFTLGVDRSASKFVIANADKSSFDGSNEAMVITSAGDVNIGSVARIDSNGIVKSANGSAAAPTHAFLNDPDNGMFRPTTNTVGFSTAGTERLRILSSGGITFNGDTAAANALDDYEEGVWTATWGDGSNTVSVTNQRYVKVGTIVYASFDFYNKNISSATGHLRVSGLPFTSNSGKPSHALLGITALNYDVSWGEVGASQSFIYLYKNGDGGANFSQLTRADWNNNGTSASLRAYIVYQST